MGRGMGTVVELLISTPENAAVRLRWSPSCRLSMALRSSPAYLGKSRGRGGGGPKFATSFPKLAVVFGMAYSGKIQI